MRLPSLTLLLLVSISLCFAQDGSVQPKSDHEKDLVLVLHGLGRTKAAMWLLATRIEDAGFEAKRIGYHSLNKSPDEVLQTISEKIQAEIVDTSRTVHFVGHSLGGLMIRAYLDSNRVTNLGRVVLMGTPNQGTVLVDKFRDTWWMKMLGPMTLALGTDSTSFPGSIGSPYYPIGIIAGIKRIIDNDFILPGADDGLVPVRSTVLNGMTDLVIVDSGHLMMRFDKGDADQTVAFLMHGRFIKKLEGE